jgi:DNA mismatch endonuclease (patch repair protein)
MVDHVAPDRRSYIMSRVRTKDTKPELLLRRLLHRLGYRFRLHRRDLPGCPDVVFPSRRKVVFVHGCYWHGHHCRWGKLPKSRLDYWGPKIEANRERDARHIRDLREVGWAALTVWQCELRRPDSAVQRVIDFLKD